MDKCEDTHNCASCPTRHTTEWQNLSETELTALDRAKRSHLMEPGEIVYHQGDQADGVYCIQSGLVGLRYYDEDGRSALLRLCAAGSTVGYGAFLSKQAYSSSAEILIPSVVCFLDRFIVSKMLASNPKVGERFLQHSIADLAESESDYARSLTGTVRLKFLHLMMVFYERLGYLDDLGNPVVKLPLLRREIADLIGAQPESISRLVRKVQDDGLLRINGKYVMFSDMDKVRQEAGVE